MIALPLTDGRFTREPPHDYFFYWHYEIAAFSREEHFRHVSETGLRLSPCFEGAHVWTLRDSTYEPFFLLAGAHLHGRFSYDDSEDTFPLWIIRACMGCMFMEMLISFTKDSLPVAVIVNCSQIVLMTSQLYMLITCSRVQRVHNLDSMSCNSPGRGPIFPPYTMPHRRAGTSEDHGSRREPWEGPSKRFWYAPTILPKRQLIGQPRWRWLANSTQKFLTEAKKARSEVWRRRPE